MACPPIVFAFCSPVAPAAKAFRLDRGVVRPLAAEAEMAEAGLEVSEDPAVRVIDSAILGGLA